MRFVITGGSGGLGRCISSRLFDAHHEVMNWSLDTGVDVSKESSVELAADKLVDRWSQIDGLINCAGVNKIEFLPKMQVDLWDDVMNVNAKGIFLVTRALLSMLHGGTVLNIVSNAAHVPMTSSLAYNASKGAALIMTKQMARELGKTHNMCVFSISPNKLKGTGMSKKIEEQVCRMRGWTREEAEKYQLAALPAGEETDPDTLAEFITFLLSSKQRHKFLQGCDITYGGP
jgi:meso-butanediol dehydrogenase/(S,S)-butanediol dehydrogenase/diacetyl reductase